MRNLLLAGLVTLLSWQSVTAQENTPPVTVKEYPVLWHQKAAEYRALCYQAFNLAELRLQNIPKEEFKNGKLAIITDLDETILDNSYSEAQLIKEGKSYTSASWTEWVNRSAATGVPGAADFLRSAAKKGVAIFYISNRGTGDIQSTLLNLQKLGLPNADTEHMLFLPQGAPSNSKETRRQTVMGGYHVIMLLGDNLSDFTNAFEKGSVSSRFAETDKAREDWGKKFIVLPNSIYGEWEDALYNYQRGLTPEQKQAILIGLLQGY